MADYQDIIYDIEDRIATIAFNRPKSLNAFTGDTIVELEEALQHAIDSRDVAVIVLTGTGERAFCVGGDVNWEQTGGLEDIDFKINRMIIDCLKPTIARINGYAIGAGNHLAYFCDISIAAEHAIFGQNGPRVGSPASGHIVSYLANVVGHKRAREMWMLCRKYAAKEMLGWGLVNAVVPMEQLDAEVKKWADEMLALSPTCLKVVKQTFRDNVDDVMAVEMRDVLERVAPNYFDTGEQTEGANAFVEKRAPDFSQWR